MLCLKWSSNHVTLLLQKSRLTSIAIDCYQHHFLLTINFHYRLTQGCSISTWLSLPEVVIWRCHVRKSMTRLMFKNYLRQILFYVRICLCYNKCHSILTPTGCLWNSPFEIQDQLLTPDNLTISNNIHQNLKIPTKPISQNETESISLLGKLLISCLRDVHFLDNQLLLCSSEYGDKSPSSSEVIILWSIVVFSLFFADTKFLPPFFLKFHADNFI